MVCRSVCFLESVLECGVVGVEGLEMLSELVLDEILVDELLVGELLLDEPEPDGEGLG